jgi:hypothetical protein
MRHWYILAKCTALVCFSALVIITSGCSRPVGSITGKVTYKGAPLKGGGISFASTEGLPTVSGNIKEDGTYIIDEIKGGSYKICIDTSFLKPASGPGPSTGPGGKKTGPPKGMGAPPPDANIPEGYIPSNPAEAAGIENARRYIAIPDKYKDPESTDLTYTVVGGPQTHDVDLK